MAASTRSEQLAVSDTGHTRRRDVLRRAAADASATGTVVFVVDDDPSMRDSLRRLITSVGFKVEVFASARAFLDARRPDAPGCLVLDVRLPGLSGLDLQRELVETDAELPIIFITGHGDVPMSVKAMKAGAIDFLTKPVREQEMLDAVTGALERDRKRRAEEKSNSDARARFALLTPRERQIMALVTGGLMNKQVAGKIGISERTVKIHRGNVMRKMRTKSLADLVMIAESLGIRGKENQES